MDKYKKKIINKIKASYLSYRTKISWYKFGLKHGEITPKLSRMGKRVISGKRLTEGQNLTKYALTEHNQSIHVISKNQLGHI